MKDQNCPFCNPDRIIEDGDEALVVASNPRLTFGHLLVIPRRHVEKPWELTDDEAQSVWRLIKKYQKLLSESIGQGCDARENYRPFLPQNQLKIDHIHWHLIPRTDQDEIYLKTQIGEKDLFQNLDEDELDRLRQITGRII